jgi:PAS domain S-box-containing protein
MTKQNERQQKQFVEQAPVAIAMFDVDMRYLSTSALWRRDFHLETDVVGLLHYDVFPEISEKWRTIHRRALAGEVFREDEEAFVRHDGEVRWLKWEVRPWYKTKNDIGGLFIYSEDITSRVLQRAELQDSEARLRAIVETAFDAIIVIGERGVIRSINPAAQKLFGYSSQEAVGQNVKMLMPPSFSEKHDSYIANYLETGKKQIIGIGRIVDGQKKDGSFFPMELAVGEAQIDGARIFMGFIRDLTKTRQLEALLHHAQKMEALGVLVSGIAHDFNNVLQAILSGFSLLDGPITPEDRQKLIVECRDDVRRGKALTDQMMAFSRRRPIAKRLCNLNTLINDISGLIRRTFDDGGIVVVTRLTVDPWPIICDASQVENAILNLAINARDAMPVGGKLTIETRNETIEKSRSAELAAGEYAVVAVSDTGTGMSPDTLARILEPFYTTKEEGKGTGLGLSIVNGMVKSCGGGMDISSERGIGTCVVLYFSRAQIGCV